MMNTAIEKIAKPVEEYLNQISYGSDDDYIPSDFALEFINFIKLVNGSQGEENLTPVLHYKMLDQVRGNRQHIVNMLFRGSAKLQPNQALIATPSGWTTMGAIQVGDELFNRYGEVTHVTFKTPPMAPQMYNVTFSDGAEVIFGDEHNHITVYHNRGKWTEKIRTTQEMYDTGVTFPCGNKPRKTSQAPKQVYRFKVPLIEPLKYSYKQLPLEPYILGYGLANGNYKSGMTFCHALDMIELIWIHRAKGANIGAISIAGDYAGRFYTGRALYKQYGNVLSRSKVIPLPYLQGSVEQRTELLRGLMDGDGAIAKNGSVSYSSYSKQLAHDVRDLARSLGAISYVKEYLHTDRNRQDIEYMTVINIKINPFRLKRKANKWKPTKKLHRHIVDIQPIENTGSGYCIEVASEDHSYITDSFLPTRNTTLLGEYLFLYLGVYGELPGFGKVQLAIYVSDSIENGVKNMRKNLEYRWQNSEFLQQYIPNTRFTDVRWEFNNLSGDRFIVTGYGAKTGVRGKKEMGVRPTLALLDDLISDEDARSATIISSIEDTVYKAVKYALHPKKSKVIWSGTPFNSRDPLYKAVESGAWYVNVYPVCQEYPCTREEFKGAWEDRFTYDYVKESYDTALKAGKVDTFNQELMLRIMSDEDRLIHDCDISWYKRSNVLNNKGMFNFYITTDFATSETTASDFSVISVWAYNNNGDWLWVDGICKRQLMNQNIDDLFRLAQEYDPQQVGIEISGQQKGFISWIQDEMMTRNIYFNLASEGNGKQLGLRPNTDKLKRFNIMVPQFKLNKMYFPEERKSSPEIKEAISELTLASVKGFKSKHDDFIDTVSMLSSMTAWKPSEISPVPTDENSELWGKEYDEEVAGISSYIV